VTLLVWIGVALAGGAGAVARVRLDTAVRSRVAGELPAGILVVNLLGSFCLGLLTGLSVTGDALLVAGTGLLGSFTTFSTWMLQSARLDAEGHTRLALVNLAVSAAGGVAAAALGWALGAVL
jgi:CrcB protein